MDISPIEFGKVLQKLEDIQRELGEFKTRHVFRLDNIEERVEELEKHRPIVDGWGKWVEKALVVLVAVGAGILGAHV